MSLGESIRSGAKWLALGKLGNRLLEFAFGIILARLLTPADFGMVATIAVFTGFVGMFTAGGMGQSLIRAKDADEADFTAVFTLQLAMGSVVYAGFFFAAPHIAAYFHDPIYTDLVRVAALTFLLRPFYVMRNAWLTRRMDFKSRTKVSVASGVFTGVVASTLAWFGIGVWSLILSGLATSLLQNVWLARLAPIPLRLNPDTSVMRRHTRYGAKIVANDFLTYLRAEGKTLLLSKIAGPATVGLFNKAESLARLPNQLLMQPVMEPMFRALSKTQDDLDESRRLYYRAVTLLTLYTAPLYFILWWITEPFILVVYGEKWVAAAEAMRVLCLMGPFLNVMLPSSVVLAAQNRLGREMLAQAINLPLVLGACWLGWLEAGLAGAAWGYLLAQGMMTIHFYWYAEQAVGGRLRDLASALAPGLALAGLVGAALFALDQLTQAWRSNLAVVYLALMGAGGLAAFAVAFFTLPLAAVRGEADGWRARIGQALKIPKRKPTSP